MARAAWLRVVLFHSFGALTVQPVWRPLEPVRALSGYGWLGLFWFYVERLSERFRARLKRRHRLGAPPLVGAIESTLL